MNQVSEIKISYTNIELIKAPKIKNSLMAKDIIFKSWNKDEIELFETFKVLYLNNSNSVKGILEHSKGGITGTLVDVRIIMATALKSLSTALILAHNHPSGILIPSKPDINLTKKIQMAADYFDIKIQDHIIISPNSEFYSFADNGLL